MKPEDRQKLINERIDNLTDPYVKSLALAELIQATEESSRLRGAPTPAGAPGTTVLPSLALEQARKAFTVGDREIANVIVRAPRLVNIATR